MDRIVRTLCQGCHPECGVLAHVEDGRITRLEGDPAHPSSRGFICVRGRAYHEFVYHPDRLRHPLKRAGAKGGGKWQRISWDQALDEIAAALTAVRENYGAEANAVFRGTGPRMANYSTRLLAYAMGSPNEISTDLHICYTPSSIADIHTVGQCITQDVGPDYLASSCILVCGANPLVSHAPRGIEILEAKRKNSARLIVIDPRRTPLAAQADLWLQVRPGTDGALALGMLNVVISEGLYDHEFVRKWCYGFDQLSERVKEYPPELVAAITWVPADKIREAARLYATCRPAALHHRVALDQNINSTQTSRAFISLVAITGNIDVKGGNLLAENVEGYISTSRLRLDRQFRPDAAVEARRVGSREHPLICGPDALFPAFVPSPLAAEAMLEGKPYPIRGVYLAGGNPVVNMQNSRRAWQALKSLDLLAVADFFMTPTAELADYVLPAATWLERDECCDMMYLNCIAARQKVIAPLPECRDDIQIAIDLVKRLPWADRRFLPWDDTSGYNEMRVQGMGMTFEEFKNTGYIIIAPRYRKYEKSGFSTPTGKVELFATVFEKQGYDPLPGYREPLESPQSTPGLLEDYPLVLTTGGRYTEYFHSDGRQIAPLRRRVPDPVIQMHPDAAARYGVAEGDWVWVETPRVKGERVRLRASITDGIDPRVVHAAHAWWFPEKPAPEHGCFESNISVVLSADAPREEVCGSVPLRGTLCRIYRVQPGVDSG